MVLLDRGSRHPAGSTGATRKPAARNARSRHGPRAGAADQDTQFTAGRAARCGRLNNPRYTGYAVFGRWTKHETLLDPDDVAAGHVVRFRRSRPDRIVRSRRPAHPEIVSVEEFTEVQLLRRSRAAGGLPARRRLERGPKATKRPYPLQGRVRCGYCSRRMEGTPRETRAYYKWLDGLFDRLNVDRTVAALITSQDGSQGVGQRDAAKRRPIEAEPRDARIPRARYT